MSTSDLIEFNRNILSEVPGCPTDVVENAVRDSIRFFCSQTNSWTEYLDPIVMVAAQATYEIATPNDTEVAMLLDVRQNGMPLGSARVADFASTTSWRSQQNDVLQWYIVPEPGSITFVPAPETVDAPAVHINAALMPTRTATTCDSVVLEKYETTIAAGALYKLLRMRKRAWSDPELAMLYQKSYQEAVADARRQISRGLSASPSFVNVPFFS